MVMGPLRAGEKKFGHTPENTNTRKRYGERQGGRERVRVRE